MIIALALAGLIIGYVGTDIGFHVKKQVRLNTLRKDVGIAPKPIRIR